MLWEYLNSGGSEDRPQVGGCSRLANLLCHRLRVVPVIRS